MIWLIAATWFLVQIKQIFFWLYLWQLKDYHIGRLTDHFRTYKGKQIFFNISEAVRIALLVALFVAGPMLKYLAWVVLFFYVAQVFLFGIQIIKKSAKKPRMTKKAVMLFAVCVGIIAYIGFLAVFFNEFIFYITFLVVDIFAFVLVSAIVLGLQPVFVFLRKRVLTKATQKIKKVKELSPLTVIAISGSYGKTTTKEFLKTILSKKFKVLATEKHQNAEIGVAKCILNYLKPDHQIFIAEVGAYNKGKVKEVCDMIKPKIGIITGINEQHLALFGSFENLLSGEGGFELAESLSKDGFMVFNGDNKHCLDVYKRTDYLERKLYAQNNKSIEADVWADSATFDEKGISFVAVDKKGNMAHFGANVIGLQNVSNLLAAILVASELGMTFEEISDACKQITPSQAGATLKTGKYGINVIDSSYSSNPRGVLSAVDYLKVFEGKKAIVMPCIIELGPKSKEIHEKIGKKIAEVCDLAIITTKDNYADIKNSAVQAGMPEKNIILCDKPKEIFSILTVFLKQKDVVLLEGRVPGELINLLL